MKANARHWRQVGVALMTAAPFLPPPWNVVAAALGAVFTAAGEAILRMYAQAEYHREALQAQKEAEARAKAAQARAADAQALANFSTELAGADALPMPKTFALDSRAMLFIGLAAITIWTINAAPR